MQYKIVGYQGGNIYYVVCQQVQQTVYCPQELQLNTEYEATLDYTKLVKRYPTLVLNGYSTGVHSRYNRGM